MRSVREGNQWRGGRGGTALPATVSKGRRNYDGTPKSQEGNTGKLGSPSCSTLKQMN